MKKWMIGCLIVALTGLAGEGLAQRRERPGRTSDADRVEMMKEAGLSDEQIAEIREIRDAVRREVIELRSQAQLARLDLRKEMDADSPDETAVMAALERAHEVQLQIRKTQVGGLLKARAVAGPEAWGAIREQAQDWFEARMEREPGPRGPRGDVDRGPPEGRPRARRGDDDRRGPPPWAGR